MRVPGYTVSAHCVCSAEGWDRAQTNYGHGVIPDPPTGGGWRGPPRADGEELWATNGMFVSPGSHTLEP